ncbi:MAG: pyruvate dehydrogenase (acetyl-transferring) E1 component subunit alpha [Deltaproteobacteria bacterium]|jgi:pyruvate dehydrogenase E1 component alpha subunit|nr:pyruvate dehydrogenase (acetyl-transferring) E1 component subunit alpha [Deltaproteobacteria bacterium]
MPIQEIDLPHRITYLSILDREGQVDEALDPRLSEELLLKLYRAMVLARRFDERMLILQRQGKIGTFAPVKGQEAQIGAAAALEPNDWITPSFRETPVEMWRGKPMENILLYFSGYNEGGDMPEGLNLLPVSVPVGSQMSHAVGIAFGLRYRGQKSVAATFFGDGATSQGDFHEAMNFASVYQLPVVFICQNNHWAISLPRSRQTNSATLAQKAIAYDMQGIQVDGNDILAVYSAVKEAAERGRAGGGPTLIEMVTYRLSMHTTADDPKKYRSEQEVAEWESRDPITRFEKYLTQRGMLDEQKIRSITQEIKAEISLAEQRWEEIAAKRIDPLDMFEHAYAEITPTLHDQREMLRKELEEKK